MKWEAELEVSRFASSNIQHLRRTWTGRSVKELCKCNSPGSWKEVLSLFRILQQLLIKIKKKKAKNQNKTERTMKISIWIQQAPAQDISYHSLLTVLRLHRSCFRPLHSCSLCLESPSSPWSLYGSVPHDTQLSACREGLPGPFWVKKSRLPPPCFFPSSSPPFSPSFPS